VGDLKFRERRLTSDEHLSFWYGGAAEDVDRDGDPDLVFVSPMARGVLFLRNHGAWDLRDELLVDPDLLDDLGASNCYSSSFADIDQNGCG